MKSIKKYLPDLKSLKIWVSIVIILFLCGAIYFLRESLKSIAVFCYSNGALVLLVSSVVVAAFFYVFNWRFTGGNSTTSKHFSFMAILTSCILLILFVSSNRTVSLAANQKLKLQAEFLLQTDSLQKDFQERLEHQRMVLSREYSTREKAWLTEVSRSKEAEQESKKLYDSISAVLGVIRERQPSLPALAEENASLKIAYDSLAKVATTLHDLLGEDRKKQTVSQPPSTAPSKKKIRVIYRSPDEKRIYQVQKKKKRNFDQ